MKALATADDVAKLKADHPRAEIQWTEPDAAVGEKMKAAFERHWKRQEKE